MANGTICPALAGGRQLGQKKTDIEPRPTRPKENSDIAYIDLCAEAERQEKS